MGSDPIGSLDNGPRTVNVLTCQSTDRSPHVDRTARGPRSARAPDHGDRLPTRPGNRRGRPRRSPRPRVQRRRARHAPPARAEGAAPPPATRRPLRLPAGARPRAGAALRAAQRGRHVLQRLRERRRRRDARRVRAPTQRRGLRPAAVPHRRCPQTRRQGMSALPFAAEVVAKATLLLAVAAALAFAIRRRAPAATRHALWAATLATLPVLPAAIALGPSWALPVLA